MIPSLPSSPSFRRDSLISQLDFEDFLAMDRNGERSAADTNWTSQFAREDRKNGLNSQSKNLQVVPDLDGIYTRSDSTGLQIQKDFTDLHLTWPTIKVNLTTETSSFNATLSEKNEDSLPRSPFLPRTSISEIDNLGILSPLFSISNTSPIIKTPTTLYEICCSSRKSSDDLSIYLPDNFTPASLESLDKSINRTVFQFPTSVSRNETINDDVFVKIEEGKSKNLTISEFPAEISASREQNDKTDDASDGLSIYDKISEEKMADKRLIDITLVREKRAKKKRKIQPSTQVPSVKRLKSFINVENETVNVANISTRESSPVARNKLERDRRNDLNNRYQRLRESIPNFAARDKASKIAILKAAADYVNELEDEEKALEEMSKDEKLRNGELLQKLVNISENISDRK